MLISADAAEALRERTAIETSLARVLARRATTGDGPVDPPLDLSHPGTYAFGFDLWPGSDAASPHDRLRLADGVARQARDSARRATEAGCPAWSVDLPPPEPHLVQSLLRAVAQLPARPDGDRPDVRLIPWDEPDRATACAAACLLAAAWPEMLDELVVMVRQVALMQGRGIAGFTDIATQGAVFVNRLRLDGGADGLPGRVRFAESLVHEGTHVRCHAATWSTPVLRDPSDKSAVARTPLRPDPRPVNGLFQQLVVVVRCWELYERFIAVADLDTERPALATRRDTFRDQTHSAVDELRRHRGSLTEYGQAVVETAAQRASAPIATS